MSSINIDQRSDEWFKERLGKITASKIADIMPLKSGKYSTSRENLAYELVAEILTGIKKPGYSSNAMQWGIDQEPIAKARYEAITGSKVVETGFYNHPIIKMCGASPDGLVGNSGIVEFKNPETSTFIKLLKTGSINEDHILQMQWQMECVGTHILYCDYFVHDSRIFDTQINFFFKRIARDEKIIETIKHEISLFNMLIDEIFEEMRENAI